MVERYQILLGVYMALNSIRRMQGSNPVSKADLYSLLDMAVQMLRLAFHDDRHAEYARPNQLELILLAVEAVSQPDAPDNVAVLCE